MRRGPLNSTRSTQPCLFCSWWNWQIFLQKTEMVMLCTCASISTLRNGILSPNRLMFLRHLLPMILMSPGFKEHCLLQQHQWASYLNHQRWNAFKWQQMLHSKYKVAIKQATTVYAREKEKDRWQVGAICGQSNSERVPSKSLCKNHSEESEEWRNWHFSSLAWSKRKHSRNPLQESSHGIWVLCSNQPNKWCHAQVYSQEAHSTTPQGFSSLYFNSTLGAGLPQVCVERYYCQPECLQD